MGWVVNAMPRPLYTRQKDPVLIVQEAGYAQGRSGRVRKISPPPVFDPRTVQSVASRYKDCAIRAHRNNTTGSENVGNDICSDRVWSEGKNFVMKKWKFCEEWFSKLSWYDSPRTES